MNAVSLCEICRWKREIRSGTGSRFVLCVFALQNKAFAKYPPQPKRQCDAFSEDAITEIKRDGFATLPAVIPPKMAGSISKEITSILFAQGGITSKHGGIVGGRNLLANWEGWTQLFQHQELLRILRSTTSSNAGVVRILFFDKTPESGWSLALHKDRTIAVKEHVDPGMPFTKPTIKAGVPHVEATRELLQQMLTVRVHLDTMHADNGPLVVVPGSHEQSDHGPVREISCQLGDVFLMRPLLTHGSKATSPGNRDHRRVLHLEVAPTENLPGGYEWHRFVPITDLVEQAGD